MGAPSTDVLHASIERALRMVASLTAVMTLLTACVSPSPRPAAKTPGEQASNVQPAADASYDWHGLLIAPFGAVLKDVPANLHEVLLFREERSGAAVDVPECYATDAPAPRFVGRTPAEYLLCFRQDRLSRIKASVPLTAAEAPEVLAVACALWQKNAAAPAVVPAPDLAPAPTPAAPSRSPRVPSPGVPRVNAPSSSATAPAEAPESAVAAGGCDGQEGSVHFSGRLADESGSSAALSIVLDAMPDRP